MVSRRVLAEHERARLRAADGVAAREECVIRPDYWPSPTRYEEGVYADHGTTLTYGRGCRCRPCKNAANALRRERRAERNATK